MNTTNCPHPNPLPSDGRGNSYRRPSVFGKPFCNLTRSFLRKTESVSPSPIGWERAGVRVVLSLLILAGAILYVPSALADEVIPARPEKLEFPALKFEPPNAADYRVQLKSGPVAYIVPDQELPLVHIQVSVRTGQYLDRAGKEGLASMTGWLLAHGGAGTNTDEQLEERLAFLAADLESDIAGTEGGVSLNLLSKDVDEGLAILRDVLYAPRFQDDKIKLCKEQMLQAMKQRNDSSESIEDMEEGFLSFGAGFWNNRHPTAASLESITTGDIKALQFGSFLPENFVVAVSGDFNRAEMIAKLEKTFGNCPYDLGWRGEGKPVVAAPAPPIPTNTVFAAPGVYLVDKPDVNQGRVSILLPGIRRDDPDFYAVAIMNDILGGGGFASRIMNRVRSDEGLAYHASSSFPGGVYYPLTFSVSFQTKSRTVAYATSIVLEEMGKIAAATVTDNELNISKSAQIERFPRIFATKKQVAETFAEDEFTGRYAGNPQHWKNYRANIAAITAADVQRVAKKYLTPEKLVILVVGNKSDILLGHPSHPVKLGDLGKITELPLRDPLTMKPVANATAK